MIRNVWQGWIFLNEPKIQFLIRKLTHEVEIIITL